jgi:hypothetical protein
MRTYTIFVALVATTLAVGQQTLPNAPSAGTINGTVLDMTGAVVPNATVVLKGAAPGDQRTTASSETGYFRFSGIQPGEPHRLVISAPGLKDWSSSQIILQPSQWLNVTSIRLGVATVTTTVSAITPEQLATEQVKAAESQRAFGFIPNFYVSYVHSAVPLTPKLKFQLAFRALIDPVTFAGFGLNAALYQAADYPSYQQGVKGFAQRLGATFAGGYTNVLVGDAVLPSLLHQDPRYFYQGTGSTKSRLWHAISSTFVTRGDNGRNQFNYSNLGGDLASGAIANAYYPDSDRGVSLVFRSALIGAGGRMANAIAQEFILRKFTSRPKPQGH